MTFRKTSIKLIIKKTASKTNQEKAKDVTNLNIVKFSPKLTNKLNRL